MKVSPVQLGHVHVAPARATRGRAVAWGTSLLLLAACWPSTEPKERGGRKRKAEEAAVNNEINPPEAAAPAEGPPAEARTAPDGGPFTVLLVVLDTVRADHTSLCGYDRPTTPYLETLVRDRGFAHTCRMVTPGTWTLPSHASFFTGLPPTEHQLLSKGYPLRDDFPTLAEHFAAKGYQTVLFSANPTLNRVSGIGRGFQHFISSPGLYAKEFRGEKLGERLDSDLLPKLDPSRPLFLVVNLFDAHDPYPAVPSGIDWVPKQPSMDINPNKPENTDLIGFLKGELNGEQRERYLKRLQDTYDWGIHEADENLARVVTRLRRAGVLGQHFRAVITSDHGENLGDHALVRHDGPPWETVVKVPLLFHDTQHTTPVTLPEPLSGLAVYHLVRDGRLPDTLAAPSSYAITHTENPELRFRQDSLAVWDGPSTKWMWVDEKALQFDVLNDKDEDDPVPAEGAGGAVLATELEKLRAAKAASKARGTDAAMMEAMRAVGYVE